MKFRILVAYRDEREEEEPWWEEFDKNVSDVKRWARETIEWFNSYCSLGERARLLVRVEILDEKSQKEHSWEKQNLVTVISGGEIYDVMRCSVCGVTGKRHGLVEMVELDRKYKYKVYARCDTAFCHLEKKRIK